MSRSPEDITLHAVLEVKRVSYDLHDKLWKVFLHTYGGSLFDLTLYTNGGEPCPFRFGDFYATEEGKRGGWKLTRLPQEEIDQTRQDIAKYNTLTPAEKAKKTRALIRRFKK